VDLVDVVDLVDGWESGVHKIGSISLALHKFLDRLVGVDFACSFLLCANAKQRIIDLICLFPFWICLFPFKRWILALLPWIV
jgi:hypothetical protein